MKAKRCAITGGALRELGDTEIDAVGGANCGAESTWTTTSTTTTSFTLKTTGNEEKLQSPMYVPGDVPPHANLKKPKELRP